MSDKKGISSTHDKKPLNKTNYTPHQNGSMPPKLQTAYNEREEKTRDSEMKGECPSYKECKCSVPENPTCSTQLQILYTRNIWPLVMDILDEKTVPSRRNNFPRRQIPHTLCQYLQVTVSSG